MYLLTLHEDSNANITLFRDNKIIFSIAEERLSRKKHQAGYPHRSLAYIKKKYGVSPDNATVVICGNRYHPLPRILWQRFPTFEHSFLGIGQKSSVVLQHFVYKSSLLKRIIEAFNAAMLKKKFGKPVRLIDHHTAHAYSAYITSGFNECVTISTDNYGDGISSAVFECKDGECTQLYTSSALNSPGQFYGELAQLLGFHPLMAGKMTGLSAYGNPDSAYEVMKELFALSENKKDFRLPPLLLKSFDRGILKKLKSYTREDIAAAAQKRFEDVMLDYIQHAIALTNMSHVALAGGIYGNVLLNKKIASLDTVKEIFIHPGMSDQGISLGVGLTYLAQTNSIKPFRLDNVYWGPTFDDNEIKGALSQSGLSYSYEENIEFKIAQILSEGKIVARFNGPLEYGPRALGNRSILYQTTDPSVNTWLNKKLHRSAFMPFAPVTLNEYAHQCYENIEKCRYAAHFMTIAFDCTEWMKKISPGVIHLDGTARPQLISHENNPSYYKIVKEYHHITGIPSLINTSFNLHEEPIVTTPHDAIRSFKTANLDYLAIGNYLAKN
ncbi:MAG: carbamoyltransferase [Candidatus Omnitrophica bacterium]|nr:carbamoyltransferase [Candidatus Omnitrophota bacterium]